MAQANPQTSFDETPIENEAVSKALTAWAPLDRSRKAVASKANEAKKKARVLLDELELPEGKYRAGPVVVTISLKQPAEVEFTTKGGTQVRFKDTTPKD